MEAGNSAMSDGHVLVPLDRPELVEAPFGQAVTLARAAPGTVVDRFLQEGAPVCLSRPR